jgi:Mce-associated membrane protein
LPRNPALQTPISLTSTGAEATDIDDHADAIEAPDEHIATETAAIADEAVTVAVDRADDGGPRREKSWRALTPPRPALLIGLTMALALAALTGLLGVRAYHAHQSEKLRAMYLQVGRQGALNLTTIDWHHADADVQRILNAATGPFYSDFTQRSRPFIEVVKKVQSVSTGSVTAAGLESDTDAEAQVLVAINVQATTADAPPTQRAWRMRISVQKTGNDVKVSNVEFVP